MKGKCKNCRYWDGVRCRDIEIGATRYTEPEDLRDCFVKKEASQ